MTKDVEASLNNNEKKLIKNQNIVNNIRSLRIGWLGHLTRMDSQRLTKKIYEWKPIVNITVGRPKVRWEDDVIKDLKKIKVENLNTAKGREAWKMIIEKAKTF